MVSHEAQPRRVGIVGCGAVVEHFYYRSLPVLPTARVVGVCDRNEAQQARVAESFRCAGCRLEELLPQIDLLVVATPPSSHHPLAMAALQAGVDAWVEKPFTATFAQASELVQTAAAARRRLHVGHFRRFFTGVRLARDLVSTGLLGRILAVEMYEGGRFRWTAQSDYFTEDPTGGVLLDTGSHTLDTALFVAGWDRVPVSCRVEKVTRDKREPAHEIRARFQLEVLGNAVPCTLDLSRFDVLANRVRLIGQSGWVEWGTAALAPVRIGGRDGSGVVVQPAEGYLTAEEAFHRQSLAVMKGTADDVLGGQLFLNQMNILERILKHDDQR